MLLFPIVARVAGREECRELWVISALLCCLVDIGCLSSRRPLVKGDIMLKNPGMNSMKTCHSVTFYFMKNSFSNISRKCILPSMIRAAPVLIIFGKIHFLVISQNEFFMKYKFSWSTCYDNCLDISRHLGNKMLIPKRRGYNILHWKNIILQDLNFLEINRTK